MVISKSPSLKYSFVTLIILYDLICLIREMKLKKVNQYTRQLNIGILYPFISGMPQLLIVLTKNIRRTFYRFCLKISQLLYYCILFLQLWSWFTSTHIQGQLIGRLRSALAHWFTECLKTRKSQNRSCLVAATSSLYMILSREVAMG